MYFHVWFFVMLNPENEVVRKEMLHYLMLVDVCASLQTEVFRFGFSRRCEQADTRPR